MRLRSSRPAIVAAVIVAVIGLLPASASTPASDSVTVPSTVGQTVTTTWTGDIPAGAGLSWLTDPLPACVDPFDDKHSSTVTVPAGLYATVNSVATFSIRWQDPTQMERLVVTDAAGNVLGMSASSMGNSNTETLKVANIEAGTYTVTACPGVSQAQAQPYTGTLSITTSAAVGGFADAVRFTPATVVDPVLFGGEPGINVDPTVTGGTQSFVDWPVGSTQNIGVLFRSTDGALTYRKRYADYTDLAEAGPACLGRQVPFCASGGGGDTQVNINSGNGILYMTSQEALANEAVGTSFDHGNTFPTGNVDPVAAQAAGDVDRQWLASWKNTSTVFLAFHSPVVGEYVMRSDRAGQTGSWYNPNGVNLPQITQVAQSGALIADNTGGPNNHALYVAYTNFPITSTAQFMVGVSLDGGKSFVSHAVPGGTGARSFTKINLDSAGNLYATWTSGADQKTYLSTSLASDPANVGHPATKWSNPVVINDPSQNVTIFPDVVAGTPGRIGIIYYGTTAHATTPDAVKPGQGGWYPNLAMSLNALCQWDAKPCTAPSFTQSHIAHQPNQDDNICTSGTACLATGGNRNLLDYFSASLDTDGHISVVWADGTNATKMPFIKVARQASGPSLIAGKPAAVESTRGNGVLAASGDALYPTSGNQVLTAQNVPQLDLRSTSVVPRWLDNNLVFRIKLADTTNLAAAVPGGGKAFDGLTPLTQAKYLVRWDYNGNTYYVGANLAAGSSTPSFFSGVVSTSEALRSGPNVTNNYGNTYAATGPAIGSVVDGALIITVPLSAVGSPAPGAKLVSVGSYALLGPSDSLAVVSTAPITVDSSPTFDATLEND